MVAGARPPDHRRPALPDADRHPARARELQAHPRLAAAVRPRDRPDRRGASARLRRRYRDAAGRAAGRAPMTAASQPSALLKRPDEVDDPVLALILERARTGTGPGARDDGHLVCLAVEGGGMRGAVSAGMCVVLEAAGLAPAFDRIYGVSAGALNGWAMAAGQSSLGATHYQDAASRRVINPMRPF